MVFIIVVLALLGFTSLMGSTGAAPAVQHYASKYDHIDVEAILNNRRMVNYYSACLLNKGPCPPEGVDLKRILPEALQTNCARCSEKQSTVALRAIKRLRKEYPKIWTQLTQQWDPNDVFVRKFESFYGSNGGKPVIPVGEVPAASSNSISNSIPDIRTPESSTTTIRISSTIASTTSPRPIVTSTSSKPSTTSTRSSTTSSRLPPSTSPPQLPSSSSTSPRPSSSSSSSRPIFLPINTFFTNPPIPIRPIANLNLGTNLGANLGATVSGFVRGLGAIGSRVMETGAEIAEVVIKNLSRPLSL